MKCLLICVLRRGQGARCASLRWSVRIVTMCCSLETVGQERFPLSRFRRRSCTADDLPAVLNWVQLICFLHGLNAADSWHLRQELSNTLLRLPGVQFFFAVFVPRIDKGYDRCNYACLCNSTNSTTVLCTLLNCSAATPQVASWSPSTSQLYVLMVRLKLTDLQDSVLRELKAGNLTSLELCYNMSVFLYFFCFTAHQSLIFLNIFEPLSTCGDITAPYFTPSRWMRWETVQSPAAQALYCSLLTAWHSENGQVPAWCWQCHSSCPREAVDQSGSFPGGGTDCLGQSNKDGLLWDVRCGFKKSMTFA